MGKPAVIRILAPLGAAALLLSAPVAASAQPMGSIDTTSLDGASNSTEAFPGSVANLAGGALAAAGSGDLGSTVAGGNCVAVDPALGSIATNPLVVTMKTKEGASGVADTEITGGAMLAFTAGTLHWTNTTTGKTGAHDFGPFGFDAPGDYFDLETGAGHVEWTVDANETSTPMSIAVPLSAAGINGGPQSSTPYTTCTGAAEIA